MKNTGPTSHLFFTRCACIVVSGPGRKWRWGFAERGTAEWGRLGLLVVVYALASNWEHRRSLLKRFVLMERSLAPNG